MTFGSDGSVHIDQSNPAFAAIAERCLKEVDGLECFCMYFLNTGSGKRGGTFSKAWTGPRKIYARSISNPRIPLLAAEAHRKFGKSVILGAECIRNICYRLTPFIVYTSSELGLAEKRTNAIRTQLINNPLIRKFFGDMKPSFIDGTREAFGTQSWKAVCPVSGQPICTVCPKSENTAVNGLLEYVEGREQRPTLIISDDGTDRKRVDDEAYRTEHMRWFFADLLPCVDDSEPDPISHKWEGLRRGDAPPWIVRVIDTCKHGDALVENLDGLAEWVSLRFPMGKEVTPGVFVSTAPELFSDEYVQTKFETLSRIGKPDIFYMEYLCQPQAKHSFGFPTEFQYYDESDESMNTDSDLFRFIIVDPARSVNPKSAATAMLVVAVDVKRARIYLRHLVNRHLSPEQLEEVLFALVVEFNSQVVCLEDQGLNDWLRTAIMNGAEKRGAIIYPVWLKAQAAGMMNRGEFGAGKDSIKRWRAATAIPFYRPYEPTHPYGHVWHENSLKNSVLEGQMHDYPRCKKWDSIDCLGYIQQVLAKFGVTFMAQYEEGSEEKRERDELDAEWEALVRSSSWRSV